LILFFFVCLRAKTIAIPTPAPIPIPAPIPTPAPIRPVVASPVPIILAAWILFSFLC